MDTHARRSPRLLQPAWLLHAHTHMHYTYTHTHAPMHAPKAYPEGRYKVALDDKRGSALLRAEFLQVIAPAAIPCC